MSGLAAAAHEHRRPVELAAAAGQERRWLGPEPGHLVAAPAGRLDQPSRLSEHERAGVLGVRAQIVISISRPGCPNMSGLAWSTGLARCAPGAGSASERQRGRSIPHPCLSGTGFQASFSIQNVPDFRCRRSLLGKLPRNGTRFRETGRRHDAACVPGPLQPRRARIQVLGILAESRRLPPASQAGEEADRGADHGRAAGAGGHGRGRLRIARA